MSKKKGKHSKSKSKKNKNRRQKQVNTARIQTNTQYNKKLEVEKNEEDKQKIVENTKQDKSNTQNNVKNDIKENSENKKKEEKGIFSKLIILIIILVALIEGAYGGYMLYEKYKSKFKDKEIEIGTREDVSVQDFVIDEKYLENSKIITNTEEIDFSKIGEYKITLSYEELEETVTLKLVDTTPPVVKFRDIQKYIDYEINPDDFIEEKSDLSEMTVEVTNKPEKLEFLDYDINVVVKDTAGNETSNICKMSIKWIKDEFAMEKGHKLSKEDLLYNAEADRELIDESKLKEISAKDIGDYEIKTTRDEKETVTIIKITDLTPPTLKLKDVTIYDDEKDKVKGKENFISSVSDASGEVTTTMKTQINYSKLGSQEIIIEAVDKYGNKTEGKATLTIRKDTVGPVISGLSAISISKGSSIDYRRGVSSKDAKDGACEFTVNSDSVNVNAAGTYYATYTSSDTKGNKTTSKRKVTVRHNQADVNALVKQIASGLSSNVEEIRDYCRNKIKYGHSYGDNDPIWYGFNNWNGNCYVHAMCFQALLKEKGYETKLIWVTNKTHYWNLVKINGTWKHMDATPDRNHRKISIMTDAQRKSTLSGRDWDHSAWPAAN